MREVQILWDTFLTVLIFLTFYFLYAIITNEFYLHALTLSEHLIWSSASQLPVRGPFSMQFVLHTSLSPAAHSLGYAKTFYPPALIFGFDSAPRRPTLL